MFVYENDLVVRVKPQEAKMNSIAAFKDLFFKITALYFLYGLVL